ncbi:MAG: class I SAM-dependent methyltransferase [Bryobacteraceae bacterium]|nr:class I SAM-dependent methyltransferase [Bryobacteraceae bacterium]
MGASENFYERYWRDGADTYSGDHQGYAVHFRKWMADVIPGLGKNPRILEVGCGDASFTKSLSTFSERVTGIDISEAQIAINAHKYPEIAFVPHDISTTLPFDTDSFDLVWCSEVLEHLYEPGFALQEAHRVLRPGGMLMVTVPYHGLFKNLCIVLFRWDRVFDPEGPHVRFFTRKSLVRLAVKADFKNIVVKTCGANRLLVDLCFSSNILLQATAS